MLSPNWWHKMNMPMTNIIPGQLSLTGPCTIYEVTELAQALIPLADTGVPLRVDLAGVTQLDCAGLQLLLALHRANKKTVFVHPSQTVIELLNHLDLNTLLLNQDES